MFSLILTPLMPCRGAMVTPSVTMARPTLTAASSLSSSSVSGGMCLPSAICVAMISAASSFEWSSSMARMGPATSMSCMRATRSARS